MSTSDLRRGPGWWMDLDGSWKPPESWPESSPPLPGWERSADGSWHDPTAGALPAEPLHNIGETDLPDLTTTTPVSRPVPETPIGTVSPAIEPRSPAVAPSPQTEAPARTLQFSETQAIVQPTVENDQILERAIHYAIIAGVLAAAIGIGLGLLLAAL